MSTCAASHFRWRSLFATGALGTLALVATPAHAHVKWFSKIVNCVSAPMSPIEVIAQPFFLFVYLVAIFAIMGVFWVEKQVHPRFLAFNKDHADSKRKVTAFMAGLLRVGVAIYFLSLIQYSTGDAHMVLTPELVSKATWVPVVQVLIALSMLWRRTEPLGALGIVCLFAFSIFNYGWYHMMDYLYFIGVSMFLLMDALYGNKLHYLGLSALRLTAGLSLLWVSTEKWMYPTWVYDILNHELQGITMGMSNQFFVMAAGFVEFCLAFLLLFGRLSSQVVALVFFILMVSAIPMVGVLDAVGHAPLLVALIIFISVENRIGYPSKEVRNWVDMEHVISFAITVPGVIGAYYFGHALAYPEKADFTSPATLTALALVVLFAWRIAMTMPQVFSLRRRRSRRSSSQKSQARGFGMAASAAR